MSKLLNYRKPVILLSQAALITLTYICSFLLRFDFRLGTAERFLIVQTVLLVLAVKLLVFYCFGLLRGWWRYVGLSDALDISKASVISFACLYLGIKLLIDLAGYPRSVLIIDMALTVLVVGGTRFLVRAYTEGLQHSADERSVLVVGAGRAGSTIVREMKRNPQLGMRPIGFVDDDPSKHGIRIHGVRVLGSTDRISEVIRQNEVQSVLIAIPSAHGNQIERIVSKCQQCRVDFKILPPISRHINGNSGRISAVRNLRLEDLLGREPVHVDFAGIRSQLEDKVLLITGAGGSIGSELSRQVANFQPRSVVLLERSENCLFQLGMELSANLPQQHFIPVIALFDDVQLVVDLEARWNVFHERVVGFGQCHRVAHVRRMGQEAAAKDLRQVRVIEHRVARVDSKPAAALLQVALKSVAVFLGDGDLGGVAHQQVCLSFDELSGIVVVVDVGANVACLVQCVEERAASEIEVVVAGGAAADQRGKQRLGDHGRGRRGRDSNPRGASTAPTRLAGGRTRPLCDPPKLRIFLETSNGV